jgi:hypothetical protein
MDKQGPDLGHGADRDSYFPAAPHVPLLEEHVGYLVAARIHDQPLDLPYVAVGRTDGQFAVDFYGALRDVVDGDLLRGLRCVRVADRPDYAPNAMLLPYPCMRVPGGVEARHGLGLLGGPEHLEFGQGAAKPNPARRSVHKVSRNKPPRAMPVLRVDYEMGDLPGDRVDDYAAYLTAGSIGAVGVGADPERHHLRHLPVFLGPWQAQPAAAPPNSRAEDRPHLAEHSLGQWYAVQTAPRRSNVRDE